MARNIVLCFDGTSNEFTDHNTNVVRLYQLLERTDPEQLTYYQTGIGTLDPPGVFGGLKKKAIAVIDLATAWLLQEHVVAGYRYLMRTYQRGDRIHLFGFSRGAYTARALAGMLFKIGLLSKGNEELLDSAWKMYRKSGNDDLAKAYKQTFARPVSVRFLGLWDTVSSVGVLFNRSLPYTANNPIVEQVRHAVAVDERRVKFGKNLWGHAPGGSTDVREVWFSGVHCDVGGGYGPGQAGQSDIPLAWMCEQALAAEIRFAPGVPLPAMPEPATAPPGLHESLTGPWWLLECLPLPYKDPRENFKTRWRIHLGGHRYIDAHEELHPSVLARMQQDPSYRPPNLAGRYPKPPPGGSTASGPADANAP